jgi:hypothetical protein
MLLGFIQRARCVRRRAQPAHSPSAPPQEGPPSSPRVYTIVMCTVPPFKTLLAINCASSSGVGRHASTALSCRSVVRTFIHLRAHCRVRQWARTPGRELASCCRSCQLMVTHVTHASSQMSRRRGTCSSRSERLRRSEGEWRQRWRRRQRQWRLQSGCAGGGAWQLSR